MIKSMTGYGSANYLAARLQASSSGTTKSTTMTVATLAATETLYVKAWQNSGSALTCGVHVRCVKLGA